MKYLKNFFIFINFPSNCSFDNRSGIWTERKIVKKESIITKKL